LRSQKKSASTVAFNLSVVRSFFEHLRAAGAVVLNPASTKLVSPPEVPSQLVGRSLTVKEVRYLLAGRTARSLRGRGTTR
jgi:site-specific recombinase XerD